MDFIIEGNSMLDIAYNIKKNRQNRNPILPILLMLSFISRKFILLISIHRTLIMGF